jgi:hypothetical protein
MTVNEWEKPLRNLLPGDIFHADGSGGASLICLVIHVDEDLIEARTVTTSVRLLFDRRTGKSVWSSSGVSGIIDSLTPLPLEIHNVILGLDRKNRLERNIERVKLSETEKKALLFVSSFYKETRM